MKFATSLDPNYMITLETNNKSFQLFYVCLKERKHLIKNFNIMHKKFKNLASKTKLQITTKSESKSFV